MEFFIVYSVLWLFVGVVLYFPFIVDILIMFIIKYFTVLAFNNFIK